MDGMKIFFALQGFFVLGFLAALALITLLERWMGW